MQEQTRNNVQYIIGVNVLASLAARLGWTETQLEAAHAELVRRFKPTLVEIG